ncbi:hypothetical protein LCGC14_1226850 [marine sediment metagenome]|uniref:Uncharacterized protein n=1 Tax=marine sediment metagenome TaxID=412755 RepID=A0A0F9LDR1_9ZZZZ
MFKEELKIFCKVMQDRLIEKQPKHGDVWMSSSHSVLRSRLEFIYALWNDERALTDKEEISLIDIANQAMLLYIRIKKK